MSSSLTNRLVTIRLGGSTCPVKISRSVQTAATQSRTPVRGVAQATRAREPRERPSPKLDRRTFLGEHTWPHITLPPAGNVWSITIHDFGKQWVEMSWGRLDPIQGKRGEKGASRNRKMNEARARGRAKGTIRKKCLTIGADHLVTLTYRANVEDRDRVLHDLERLRRALSRSGCSMPYVAVLERQQRGALHPHLAVKGFQDVRLLRRCWYKIVGNGQGQVNVRGPRPGSSPSKACSLSVEVHQ